MPLFFALALTLTPAAPVQAGWTEAIDPFEIADDLYYVGTADLGAYLFVSDEGHILIDTPLEENVDLLLRNVRSLGFDPTDIEVLLASHAHFDHVGGLARMREVTGATYPGMGAAYCRSLAILEALQPDLFLAPHGSFIALAEKSAALARGNARAFVDPEGYRDYLGRARSSIERTLTSQGHTGGCASLVG